MLASLDADVGHVESLYTGTTLLCIQSSIGSQHLQIQVSKNSDIVHVLHTFVVVATDHRTALAMA